MPITEITWPKVIPSSTIFDEVERSWKPVFNLLYGSSTDIKNCFRGWIVSENGKDVRKEYKEVVIFEWASLSASQALMQAPNFHKFIDAIKNWVTGPAERRVFETDTSPQAPAMAPVVEIIEISTQSASDVEKIVGGWDRLVGELTKDGQNVQFMKGNGLGENKGLFTGLVGWESHEAKSKFAETEVLNQVREEWMELGVIKVMIAELQVAKLESGFKAQ